MFRTVLGIRQVLNYPSLTSVKALHKLASSGLLCCSEVRLWYVQAMHDT